MPTRAVAGRLADGVSTTAVVVLADLAEACVLVQADSPGVALLDLQIQPPHHGRGFRLYPAVSRLITLPKLVLARDGRRTSAALKSR